MDGTVDKLEQAMRLAQRARHMLHQDVSLDPMAVLDGLAEIEQQVHFPQVERYILMQVDSVEEFRFAAERPRPRP
ncbi:MAG: hypothetical protein A2Y76_07045 [Planctomycetes bacterium RBG_13_60_9]|nr:MAG: hypothetical protein A2Y76_07045 [Planctomycetes bacterium RBG_13_60_9]